MTTAIDTAKRDETRQREMFQFMIESFVKRWAPANIHDAGQFHAEFHAIVRQIYRDAQEPLLSYITELAIPLPMPRSTA